MKGCVERVKAVHLIRVGGREERKKESWRGGEYLERRSSCFLSLSFTCSFSISVQSLLQTLSCRAATPPPPLKGTASNPVLRFTFLITNQTTTTQGMIDSLIQYLLEEIAMDGDEGKRLVFLSLVLVRVKKEGRSGELEHSLLLHKEMSLYTRR